MGTTTDGIEAVVLRAMRYGEADVIAHIYTREGGRRGVIAKGSRKSTSRLGARLEPFLAVRMQLHEGKGDLAIVRGVDVIAAHDALRASWRAQQLGASALDLVSRLTIEHQPNEPLHHLLRNFLDVLDSAATGEDVDEVELRGGALLAAFELKLLHVLGMAPQLGVCVRCGDQVALVAFGAEDGGVVCAGCRVAGDLRMDALVHATAIDLMRVPLAELSVRPADELPPRHATRSVASGIVAATCAAHAGVTPRRH